MSICVALILLLALAAPAYGADWKKALKDDLGREAIARLEWQAHLDSKERVSVPAWLSPILDPAGIGKPEVGRR